MIVYFYNKIPKSLRDKLGKSKALKRVRDLLLKRNGIYKESSVLINKGYLDYNATFKFIASVKDVAKAYKYGIENTMLSNSIELLRKQNQKANNMIILDIGANFGYLTMVWAKTICQNGKVIAFEPNKNVFNTLNKSITINKLNNIVDVENLAVGNENKSIELYLNNSTSNVLKSDDKQPSQMIQMTRVDDYINNNQVKKCDLIKIDVDGIEMDILKGSINVLKTFKPIFIVETNNDKEIIDFFIQNKYAVLNEKLEAYKPKDKLPLNIYCVSN